MFYKVPIVLIFPKNIAKQNKQIFFVYVYI